MQIVIDARGTVQTLYDEALDLRSLGPAIITRASQVEPDQSGQWWARIIEGPCLGPFEHRSAAIAAEVAWLEATRFQGVFMRKCVLLPDGFLQRCWSASGHPQLRFSRKLFGWCLCVAVAGSLLVLVGCSRSNRPEPVTGAAGAAPFPVAEANTPASLATTSKVVSGKFTGLTTGYSSEGRLPEPTQH